MDTRNSGTGRKWLTLLLTGTALTGVSGAAVAQDAATTAPAAAAPAPEAPVVQAAAEQGDIIVTARNRVEKLQDVPLAITSFSAETLERNQVRNLRDLSYLTPGLSITSGGSEFGVNPIIRGQTNLNAGSGDPNVGVFIDGVYISNNNAINVGLSDIERIEVVKGPVSALYGHNAFAGAINYVSKRPSLSDIQGRITGTVGNDQQYLAQGSLSVPLIRDVLAVRVAGGYEHFGGSYKDDVNGERAGGYKKRDVQGSFQFKPDSAFTAFGSYYYGNDVFGPSAIAYNANNCGARTVPLAQDPSGTGFSQFCGRFDPDSHPVEVPALPKLADASGNARKVNLASLNLSYNFGPATITSITGYTKTNQQRYTDFIGRRAGTPYTLVPGPGTVNLLELFGSNTNNRDFSQEIRLQSAGDKPFRVQAGAFYYKGKFFTTTILGLDATPIPAGQTINAGFPRNSLTVNGVLSNNIIGQTLSHDRQYSGFVGAEYDIVQGLTASGEYRYTDQKKDQLVIRNTGCAGNLTVATASCTGPAPTPYLYPNGITPASGKFTFSNYRGTLKYAIQPGMNVYASVANGTKAGGFNQRSVAAADGSQPDLKFNPETNVTYEIGSKNSLFDNRLQFNVAVYHIDTKGIQISGPSSVPTNPGLVTKNFGSVHNTGFEAELVAKVAQGVRLNGGFSYANPRFGSDAYDFGAGTACLSIPQCAGRVIIATPGTPLNPVATLANGMPNTANKTVLSLDGLHLPRTPRMQITGGMDLFGDIGSSGLRWTATGNFRYEDKQYAFNNNISTYGPRTIVNLRAGIETDSYNVALFVNNLTNDHTPEITSVNARLSDFQGDLDGYLPLGRMFGITAGYKF